MSSSQNGERENSPEKELSFKVIIDRLLSPTVLVALITTTIGSFFVAGLTNWVSKSMKQRELEFQLVSSLMSYTDKADLEKLSDMDKLDALIGLVKDNEQFEVSTNEFNRIVTKVRSRFREEYNNTIKSIENIKGTLDKGGLEDNKSKELEKELNTLQVKKKKLANELGDWLTAIDDLENKLDKKNEDINELNVILKRKDNLIKISNRRVDSLDKKNSEQKSIIQSYENKLKDSENKFRDSENKLRNSDKSIVKLNNKIKEQNSTITNYKNELKGKENEIIELNKNIKKLSEEQVKYNDIFVQQTIKLEIPKGNDNSKPVKAIGEVIIILTNVREKSLKTNFTYNIQNTMYEAEDVPQDTIAGRSIGNYLYLFEVIESNSLTPETATIRVIRVLVKR